MTDDEATDPSSQPRLQPLPDTSSFDAAAALIATWRARLRSPNMSTGGAVEVPPPPLESFAPQNPAPDLSRFDEPQLDSLSTPPDVSGLESDEAVEVIKEWFLSNFEDPAMETPRDDGEFVYIWGGPYDARDVISDAFGDAASESVIEAAIEAVEAEGVFDWAPHGRRTQPPDDQETPDRRDPTELHREMMQRIESLEDALARLSPDHGGIGHNQPPEPIEPLPFGDLDREAVETALVVLRSQPPEPAQTPQEAVVAANTLLSFGQRLRDYLEKQADIFVTEAVKAAGSEVGKWVVRLPLWMLVADRLIAVAEAARQWFGSLGIGL
ncbi:hypothetical protein [Bradyrhizobium sp. SZCCHNR3131]|uniref:hypothetical protein n=2 Tax=Bradyrhizobium TaxID=374 RepID=UPI002916EB59|nr:hypothetical protein [Bradyrhizobium sp. SZCCHNR3131]